MEKWPENCIPSGSNPGDMQPVHDESTPPVIHNRSSTDRVKDPRLDTALAAHRSGNLEEAIQLYNAILLTESRNTQVWNNLGVALRKHGHSRAAAACYLKAISIDPNWPGAWSNYGNVLKELDELEESLVAHRRALSLQPRNAAHHHHVGLTLRLMGRHDQAQWHFEQALRLKPDHTMCMWDLARVLLGNGDYARGWKAYEARWQLDEMKIRDFDGPRWNGEIIAGKSVLLYAEQGFGDTLLGLRFAKWVKDQGAAHVMFESQQALTRLVSRVDGLDHIFPRDSEIPPHDLQSSLMSLPRLFGLTLQNLPPAPCLTWQIQDRERLKQVINSSAHHREMRVGIVWSGSVTFKNNRKRSVPLARFFQFAHIPNVKLFSLQKGPPQEDLQKLACPALVVDLGSHLRDFADTAAALQDLDLVIMTDSSVAHLAGSLDVPVWNLLDFEAYWLYLNHREDTPWYPSMRLFRQSKPNDWDGVFDRVAGELAGAAARKAQGDEDMRHALLPHMYHHGR